MYVVLWFHISFQSYLRLEDGRKCTDRRMSSGGGVYCDTREEKGTLKHDGRFLNCELVITEEIRLV